MSYDSIRKAGNEHLDDIPTGKNNARISKVSPFFSDSASLLLDTVLC